MTQLDHLNRAWNETTAAGEFEPLPAGEYITRIVKGELVTSNQGTPGYRIHFEIIEGDHVGRRCWHTCWLTENALPLAKRDLDKLGVTSLDQLQRPMPQGIRCQVKLVLRTNNDGEQFNKVRSFVVVGFDAPDPFAPELVDTRKERAR